MRHLAQWCQMVLSVALLYLVVLPLAFLLRLDPPRDWEENQ